MALGDTFIYDGFRVVLIGGIGTDPIDFDDPNLNILIALLTGYTFDKGHLTWANVSGFEVSGSGYTAGGKQIDGRTVFGSGDASGLDANDVLWTGLDVGPISHAVIYVDPGLNDRVLFAIDLAGTETGNLTIQWAANGAFRVE